MIWHKLCILCIAVSWSFVLPSFFVPKCPELFSDQRTFSTPTLTHSMHDGQPSSLLNHLLSPATRATRTCFTWYSASGVWSMWILSLRIDETTAQWASPVSQWGIAVFLLAAGHSTAVSIICCSSISCDSAITQLHSVHSPCAPRHV